MKIYKIIVWLLIVFMLYWTSFAYTLNSKEQSQGDLITEKILFIINKKTIEKKELMREKFINQLQLIYEKFKNNEKKQALVAYIIKNIQPEENDDHIMLDIISDINTDIPDDISDKKEAEKKVEKEVEKKVEKEKFSKEWIHVENNLWWDMSDYSNRIGYNRDNNTSSGCLSYCDSLWAVSASWENNGENFCQCYNSYVAKSDRTEADSFIKWWVNCSAQNIEINGHIYTIEKMEHGSSIKIDSRFTNSLWSSLFTQNFFCGNGKFINIWNEVVNEITCNKWYFKSWNSCIPDTCDTDVIKIYGYTPSKSITIDKSCGPIVLNLISYDPGKTLIVNNSWHEILKINYITYESNEVTYDLKPKNWVSKINAIDSSNSVLLEKCPNSFNWWSPWTFWVCDWVFDSFFSQYSSSNLWYRFWIPTDSQNMIIK